MINICPTQFSVDRASVIHVPPRAVDRTRDPDELCDLIREALDKADTMEALGPIIRDFVALVGYDNFNIAIYTPAANSESTLFIFNGYAREWWQIYVDRHYVDFDPIMSTSVGRCAPYEWHEIDFSKASPKAGELFMEAARFGLMGGFSARVIGAFGTQVYASISTEQAGYMLGDRRNEVLGRSLLFCSHLADAFLRAVQKDGPGLVGHNLTPRQLTALQLSADGMPHKKIAQKMGIVERSVDHHIKEALGRLRRKTRSSAIALAAQMGLIVRDMPMKLIDSEIEPEEAAENEE